MEASEVGNDTIGVPPRPLRLRIRPLAEGGSYVRTTKWVLPFVSLVPASAGTTGREVDGVIFIVSPVDGTHHWLFFGFWSDSLEINDGCYTSVPDAQRSIVDRSKEHLSRNDAHGIPIG